MTDEPRRNLDRVNKLGLPVVSIWLSSWCLWLARGLFAAAAVAIAMMIYESFQIQSEETIDFGGSLLRVYWYSVASVCLGSASSMLYAMRKITIKIRTSKHSGNETKSRDVAKNPAVLLMVRFSSAPFVFLCAIAAFTLFETQPTHPIMPAIFITTAILTPAMFEKTKLPAED